MSENWGPHYIYPSSVIRSYSGVVMLREQFDEDLLHKELKEYGFRGAIVSVDNPWYYRNKNESTWIQIGESDDRDQNFPVRWDTTCLQNGQYEVMGMMHINVQSGPKKMTVARQNIVEVTVEN